MRWVSQDEGRTWTGEEIDLSGLGAFAILDDDTFKTRRHEGDHDAGDPMTSLVSLVPSW